MESLLHTARSLPKHHFVPKWEDIRLNLQPPPTYRPPRRSAMGIVGAALLLLLAIHLTPSASAQQLGNWSYLSGASTVNPTISATFSGGRSGFASVFDPIKRNFYLFGGLGVPDEDGVPRKFSRPS